MTRADIAGFCRVYRDTGTAATEFAHSLKQLALMLVLIPVHALIWLWLPELGEQERIARELARRRWADEDF
jgi:uncharacterized membrane protein affecting hemolysin expression